MVSAGVFDVLQQSTYSRSSQYWKTWRTTSLKTASNPRPLEIGDKRRFRGHNCRSSPLVCGLKGWKIVQFLDLIDIPGGTGGILKLALREIDVILLTSIVNILPHMCGWKIGLQVAFSCPRRALDRNFTTGRILANNTTSGYLIEQQVPQKINHHYDR